MYELGDIIVISKGLKIREESRVFPATKEDSLPRANDWASFVKSELPKREVFVVQVVVGKPFVED